MVVIDLRDLCIDHHIDHRPNRTFIDGQMSKYMSVEKIQDGRLRFLQRVQVSAIWSIL